MIFVCLAFRCLMETFTEAHGEDLSTVKVFWLCGFYYKECHVESYFAPCLFVFQSSLTLWSPRFGKEKTGLYEPRHEKTCLRDFRPGMTQTGLLSTETSNLQLNSTFYIWCGWCIIISVVILPVPIRFTDLSTRNKIKLRNVSRHIIARLERFNVK